MTVKKKPSQCTRLLSELKLRKGKGVDPLHAWEKVGIYRLASRINDLRNKGEDIVTCEKVIYNEYGERVRVANYLLAEWKPEHVKVLRYA